MMKRFLAVIEVYEEEIDKVKEVYSEEAAIEDIVEEKFGWLEESGIHLCSLEPERPVKILVVAEKEDMKSANIYNLKE
jgi:hypothetical protein